MFEASPFLWQGKERLQHEFTYKHVHNEEAFDEVLEMADQVQNIMINGVIQILEKKKK